VAALNHPHIVTIYSVEEAAGVHFLTMELVDGHDLSALITPEGLSLAQLLDLMIPFADALLAAHEKGIVHRDLKPANVMVTREGRLKVLDFGLAKLTPGAPETPEFENTQMLTMTSPLSVVGEVMGTAPYMSPEQLRGEVADARADLFAFGVIVQELAGGRRPFGGRTFAEVSDELAALRSSAAAGPTSQRAQAVAAPRTSDGPSIAVLPLVNMSVEPENEYFSDGLTEELMNLLTKIRGLRVAARTPLFHFKGKTPTIAEVGRALNVATVLEGSVRKAGDRVRISVKLVKVADGYPLWSEQFDRKLDDIFAVQDDVARAVVAALPGALLISEQGLAANRGTHDGEAYDAFLEARSKASEAALRALELRPDLGSAHATLGYVLMIDLKWTEAEHEYRRAIELSPDEANAHKWYADLLMMTGRSNAALRELRRALELDPLSANIWTILGEWHWFEGQLDEAMASYRKALELTPTLPLALELAARLCWQRGEIEPYFSLRERLEAVSQRVAAPTATLREGYARDGRAGVLRAQLSAPVARLLPSDRARWHAELGDLDAAFRDLGDSLAQREIRLPYVTYFADFAPLWKDVRFEALLVRMGVR